MLRFSDTVMEHFFSPRNVGRLVGPCVKAEAGSMKRGVFMCIYVTVSADRVSEMRYLTYGCVPAIAAGSLMTEWARGHSVGEVLAYTPQQLIDALGGLPRGRRFCAELAVQAMHSAVRDAITQTGDRS